MQSDLQKRCSLAFGLGLDDYPLYSFQSHREVLDGLRSGLEQGQHLLCLTGPPGSGKSAVLSELNNSLTSGFVGLITQPGLGDVLSRLKGRLQLSTDNRDPVSGCKLLAAVYEAQQHHQPIIQLVDNADKLQQPDFIQLNRLFQRFGGQLILSGTPALLSLFQTSADVPDPAQPEQIFQLMPLTEKETGEYIQHRLRQVDFDPDLFTAEALTVVHHYSGGIPQLINMLCFMALAESCGSKAQSITADAIHDVAKQRWTSGIYPFHSPPPAPETAAECAEHSPSLAQEGRLDTTFLRPETAPEPVPDCKPLNGDDQSRGQPLFSADTVAAAATETVHKEPVPDLFTPINRHAPDHDLPKLYGEQRPSSSATPVDKPRHRKPWLITGLASTAIAALGIALYVNSSLFAGKYEQLKSVASEKVNQLACADSGENALASKVAPPEIITPLPSAAGTAPNIQSPSVAQQDGANQVRNAAAVSPPAETARTTLAVTENTDSNEDAQAVKPIVDSVSDFAAFEQPATVPTQTEKPTDIDRPMADGDHAPDLSSQPDTTRRATAATETTALSRGASGAATTADTASDFAAIDHPTAVPAQPQNTSKIEDRLAPQTQALADTASEQQSLPDATATHSETHATPPTAGQPAPDATATALLTTRQPRPMAQTDQTPVKKAARETSQASPSPALRTAQQSHIASLYLKRAEYEVRNGHYRDALISVGYGLESVPGHPALTRMRARVLKAMND